MPASGGEPPRIKPTNHLFDLLDAANDCETRQAMWFPLRCARVNRHRRRGRIVHAMKTESETNFEDFCRRNGFALLPVPVTTTKTPDYTLTVGEQLVVVEVKEI